MTTGTFDSIVIGGRRFTTKAYDSAETLLKGKTMDLKKYLEQNKLTESQLTKEEVWQAAQRQLVANYIASYSPICLTFEEIDKIIEKINERA